MPFIFLDPDGTQDFGLLVLVLHPTGVTYSHQCAGYANEQRRAEGFLLPLGGRDLAQPLVNWFRKTFRGHGCQPASAWPEGAVVELAALVAQIPCWWTTEEGEDRRGFLNLDKDRLDNSTEGWIPVLTAYGRSILLFKNSD